jgi:hypothetical protein
LEYFLSGHMSALARVPESVDMGAIMVSPKPPPVLANRPSVCRSSQVALALTGH